MFANPGFWPRVSTYEGREIERALAGPNLLDPGIRLGGAVVEASYAVTKPSVLGRLQETDTAYVVDPGSAVRTRHRPPRERAGHRTLSRSLRTRTDVKRGAKANEIQRAPKPTMTRRSYRTMFW